MAKMGVTLAGIRKTGKLYADIQRRAEHLTSYRGTKIVADQARRDAPRSSPPAPLRHRRKQAQAAGHSRPRRLRNAVKIVRPGRVGINVAFGTYVHWGTTRQRAQPFIIWAVAATRAEVAREYEKALQQQIDRADNRATRLLDKQIDQIVR